MNSHPARLEPTAALDALCVSLSQTLSANALERRAAELALEGCELEPGHVVMLFRLSADLSLPADPQLRQAAVIRMKNIVAQRWSPRAQRDGQSPTPLPDGDKELVRSNLAEALVFAPSVVRSQLGLCARCVAYAVAAC